MPDIKTTVDPDQISEDATEELSTELMDEVAGGAVRTGTLD